MRGLTVFCAGLAVVAAAVFAATAAAQPGASQAELEACAAQSGNRARLRCFQQLTDRGRQPEAEAVVADEVAEGLAEVVEETEEVDDRTAYAEAVAARAAEAVERAEQAAADSSARAAEAAAAGSAEQAEQAASESRDLGREQLREERQQRLREERQRRQTERLTATVQEVTTDSLRRLRFRLDNGNIWRQMESGYFPYPKDGPFEVEISRGMMGEYRLRVEGDGRLLRIRRIQ